MDFAVCPSCQQSVLDDDAEECPFCGASMSGKPSAKAPKPAAAAPKKPSQQESKPKPSSPSALASGTAKTAKKAPSEPPPEDDSDPFDIDTDSSSNAVQCSSKPVKGRTYKVVCPMCETVGFIPRSAAGKEARCANADCLVPTFTAPLPPPKKEPEPEPPKKGLTPLHWFGMASILLLMGGAAGAWYFLSGDQAQNQPDPVGQNLTPAPEERNSVAKVPPTGDSTTNAGEEKVEVVDAGPSLAEIQQEMLTLMHKTAFERNANRSKPFCRCMTAAAYAESGDLAGAREQLDHLARVGKQVPFYRIMPLVTIAWKQWDDGQSAESKNTIDEAWDSAAKLPSHGRGAQIPASALSSALVLVERDSDARKLIRKHRNTEAWGQLAVELLAVRDFQTFDLDAALESAPLLPRTEPQAVSVTLGLTARGQFDAARRFAEQMPTVDGRIECLTAWAEAMALAASANDSSSTTADWESAATKLPPAGKAFLFARVAYRQLENGKKSEAEQSLKAAQEALVAVKSLSPIVVDSIRSVMKLKLPDFNPLRMKMLAAGEVARIEAQLGNADTCWQSLSKALSIARAMAPSPTMLTNRIDAIKTRGKDALRAELTNAFRLKNRDEADRKLREYSKRCRSLLTTAQKRLELQVALLVRATEWAPLNALFDEMHCMADADDSDLREPYFETVLPWVLADALRRSGDRAASDAIRARLKELQKTREAGQAMARSALRYLEKGQLDRAVARIESARVGDLVQAKWIMRLACRLQRTQDVETAFQFLSLFRDSRLTIPRELSLELVSAMATKQGQGADVWRLIQESSSLSPTARIAACRGFVAGVNARPDAQQVDSAATSLGPDDS